MVSFPEPDRSDDWQPLKDFQNVTELDPQEDLLEPDGEVVLESSQRYRHCNLVNPPFVQAISGYFQEKHMPKIRAKA